MVEVLITNVKLEGHSEEILHFLKNGYPTLKINFDLEDFNRPYPCGHSILRIEGGCLDTVAIIRQLRSKGIECDLLDDKICV
ncbi:hypothetical protein [Maribacter sp. MAR_2009_72]|uniref:hypothetical protein n=1 Tax=Maribacter sp. MAR_2009_72 TaxID=1250050 RepID=UPI00119AA9CE|nr:hypothetical protein [Maribacter sp. MAR_2009_72]TVZ15631.1 hypothetical protein JM81_1882 [Maribacter sp. MAR_2009_72]